MAYKTPTELGMSLGRQSSTDEGLRNAYQAEIVNQLRNNQFQSADAVWANVDAQRKAAQQAQQPSAEMQQFLQSNPQANGMGGNGQAMWGIPGAEGTFRDAMTVEQIQQSGQVPTEGQWVQPIYGGGGDQGGTWYMPYHTYWDNSHGGA